MIDIKAAVTIAREHFTDFFSDKDLGEIMVETFEFLEDPPFWQVTLACDWHPQSGTGSIGPGQRLCKTLKIEAESGRVVGMKNDTI